MSDPNNGKQHVSVVICGHVDSGKSTTTGRLIFELGGIPEREMEKLRKEADALGKSSFAFAFYMDRQKEERARGVTISCTTKEFYTEKYHYTIVDAPGHRDYIKNMITGSSQADVAVLMIPADGNFITSIARGNAKEGEVMGQSRMHAQLINLLGVKQLIVGINKMDSSTANWGKERYDEIKNEVTDMLVKLGWPKGQVEKGVPFVPISGWLGDNLIKKSANMAWWDGVEITLGKGKGACKVVTLLDALDTMVQLPPRATDKPLRVPISGVHKGIKGVGTVYTGRIEQGLLKPGDEICFLPTHTATTPCTGKVFSIEMHHKQVEVAGPGDNIGFTVKGLKIEPSSGDVMVLLKDATIKGLTKTSKITAQVQVLQHPNELKPGYTPVGHIRTGRAPLKLTAINWKMGKDTGGAKADNPPCLKTGDTAEVVFEPQMPFVADTFEKCEGLARLALMESSQPIMLGKIVAIAE
jgi:elongation factor 1-alpha